jgi:hypothetical protein
VVDAILILCTVFIVLRLIQNEYVSKYTKSGGVGLEPREKEKWAGGCPLDSPAHLDSMIFYKRGLSLVALLLFIIRTHFIIYI